MKSDFEARCRRPVSAGQTFGMCLTSARTSRRRPVDMPGTMDL
ncbi:hypothetical protein [Lancefieldella rimae]|nr:hypothetical protein [Lancefieldella rimae]